MLEGQEQGDHQHNKMGVYELMEGKEVNGRGVWQLTGGEEYVWFVYYNSKKQWTISDWPNMEVGKATGRLSVASTAFTPDQITETWQVTKRWRGGEIGGEVEDGDDESVLIVDAPKVRTRLYSAEEKHAAAERLEQAMAAARDIRVEGQQKGWLFGMGDHHHNLMGVYELVEGKQVNGRGVWQMAGGQECFIYYGSTKQWFIDNRARMEVGKGGGWMKVASTALTPDQITETWKVTPGPDKAWVVALKMTVRVYFAEEKRAAAKRLEQERQWRLEQEWQWGARDIRVEGLQWSDHQYHRMGVYELMEGKEVNGRGVWECKGWVWSGFMYYGTKQWLISDRENMEAGKDAGFMCVASTALTPEQITETWQVHPVDTWVDVPKVRARRARSVEEEYGKQQHSML
jgi:hypothetical protein